MRKFLKGRVFRNLMAIWNLAYKHRYKIGITLSSLLLLIVAIYSALQSSAAQLSVGDQYNSTYMVKDWHPGDELNILSQRTNLLKLPLLWIQGQLPYGIASHYILNTILVFSTLLGWSALTYLFLKSRTAFIVSNIILSGILLGSIDFAISITMPTIRNIEYLLAFGFILLLKSLLIKHSWAKWSAALLILGALVASDYLFLYTLPVAAIVGILIIGYQKKFPVKQVLLLLAAVVGGCMSGVLLLRFLDFLGVFNLIDVPRAFLAYDFLLIHVQNTFHHVLRLFGGDFFGRATNGSMGYVLNAAFLAIAISSIYKARKRGFVGIVISLLALLVILAYLLSGQAVPSAENIRYLTILPFVGVLSVLIVIKSKVVLFVIAGVVLLAGVSLVASNRYEYRQRKIASNNFVALDNKVTDYLYSNNIKTALGTIAYSAPTWFYTQKDIDVYDILPCNGSNLPLSNSRWYTPSSDMRYPTALIIDHVHDKHVNGESWGKCSDNMLENIYGQPILKKHVGTNGGMPVDVWIYNYDIRSKLKSTVH